MIHLLFIQFLPSMKLTLPQTYETTEYKNSCQYVTALGILNQTPTYRPVLQETERAQLFCSTWNISKIIIVKKTNNPCYQRRCQHCWTHCLKHYATFLSLHITCPIYKRLFTCNTCFTLNVKKSCLVKVTKVVKWHHKKWWHTHHCQRLLAGRSWLNAVTYTCFSLDSTNEIVKVKSWELCSYYCQNDSKISKVARSVS